MILTFEAPASRASSYQRSDDAQPSRPTTQRRESSRMSSVLQKLVDGRDDPVLEPEREGRRPSAAGHLGGRDPAAPGQAPARLVSVLPEHALRGDVAHDFVRVADRPGPVRAQLLLEPERVADAG